MEGCVRVVNKKSRCRSAKKSQWLSSAFHHFANENSPLLCSTTDGLEQTRRFFLEVITQVGISNASASAVAEFLCEGDCRNRNLHQTKIRTAIVKTNFTDTCYFLRNLKLEPKICDTEIILVSPNISSVKHVSDQLLHADCKYIIVFEQVESMSRVMASTLLSLLVFYSRYYNSNITLVLCMASPSSSFVQLCQLELLSHLEISRFVLPDPQQESSRVLLQLMRVSHQESGFFLSAELLKMIRRQFLLADFSLASVTSIILLAILDQGCHTVTSKKSAAFVSNALSEYWKCFDLFASFIQAALDLERKGESTDPVSLHIRLNTDVNFWSDDSCIGALESWFSRLPPDVLASKIEEITGVCGTKQNLLEMAASLRMSRIGVKSAPTTSTMSGADFYRMRDERLASAIRERGTKEHAASLAVAALRHTLQAFQGNRHIQAFALRPSPHSTVEDGLESLLSKGSGSVSALFCHLHSTHPFSSVAVSQLGNELGVGMEDAGQMLCGLALLEEVGAVSSASPQSKVLRLNLHSKENSSSGE